MRYYYQLQLAKPVCNSRYIFQISVIGPEDPQTALVVDLTGIDPDDVFSLVPYEKGSNFLWYLEEVVGGAGTTPKHLISTFRNSPFIFRQV